MTEEVVRYDRYQNELRVGDYVVCAAYGGVVLGVIDSYTDKMVKLSVHYNKKMRVYHAYTEQLIKFDRDQALINLMRVNYGN